MNDYPTRSQPWYVVYKREPFNDELYYTLDGDGELVSEQLRDKTASLYSALKAHAVIFDNIHNAARVAGALAFDGAMIRLLVRREEAFEFGRGKAGERA